MKIHRYFFVVLTACILATPIYAEVSVVQPSSSVVSSANLVNLNDASVNELMKVKGMTASKAKSIVSYRKKNGSFKSLDELTNVKGFTRIKVYDLKTIQDQLTL